MINLHVKPYLCKGGLITILPKETNGYVLQSTLWAISLLTQTTLTFQLTFSADKNKEIKQKRKNINQQKRQSPNKRNQFVDSVQTNLTLRYQAHLSRSEKRDDHQLELYTCRSNLNLIGTT